MRAATGRIRSAADWSWRLRCTAPRGGQHLDSAKWLADASRGPSPAIHGSAACRAAAFWFGPYLAVTLVLCILTSIRPRRWPYLARRIPPLLAALGMLLCDGLFEAARDTNHRWLLPSLCFAILALDDPAAPVAGAREAVLVATSSVFGAAGCSKLTASTGWPQLGWARGQTLRWHLATRRRLWAARLLLDHPPMMTAAAASTIFFELSGVALLVLELAGLRRRLAPLRPAILVVLALAWSGFHAGVLLAMPNVNYVPSAIVYLTLLVPWATGAAAATRAPAERRWVVVRAAIALAYGGAALTHTEFWPVTSVPMFSHLRDAEWTRACLKPEQTAQLAGERLAMTGISSDWLSVEAVSVAGAANDTRLVRVDVNGLVSTSSWKSMWTEAVVDGLRDNARRGANFSAAGGGGVDENDAFALAAGRLLPVLEDHKL